MGTTVTAAPPAIGIRARDFTLASTSGVQVTLSSLRGRRVLAAFFPLAFTNTCTVEVCVLTNHWDGFAEAGVTVLPISGDSIPTPWEFKAKYGCVRPGRRA